MKANLVSADTLALADYVDIESARFLQLAASPAFREGMEAFRRSRRGTT